MTHACENCNNNPVDIARTTTGTPTAKLIAILEAHGITSASEIAEIVGITDRAVRKVRNSRTGTQVPPGTPGPELQDRSGTPVPKTELQDRNSGSALARANNESPSEISLTEEVKILPPNPHDAETPPVAKPKATRTRGSRLDPTWQLPDDWRMWARTIFPGSTDEQVTCQADQFRDYWIAKPGAMACKLDWEATWRNWCRRGLSAADSVRQPQHTGAYKSRIDWSKLEIVNREPLRHVAA